MYVHQHEFPEKSSVRKQFVCVVRGIMSCLAKIGCICNRSIIYAQYIYYLYMNLLFYRIG